jgi:hypothetical protein
MPSEHKLKHLEMIQLTITRMNANSFIVKGWLMTLVAAVFALSQKDANKLFLWFAPFASIVFWMLDGFYVSTERKCRNLYNHVRMLKEEDIDFAMDLHTFETGHAGYFTSLLSITLMIFYPIIIIASVLAASLF